MHLLLEQPLFFVLAYAGMFIHILMKLAETEPENQSGKMKSYMKKHKYSLWASVLMIPVLLILATDTSLKDILPLNYFTATMVGWQTNSTFKAVMSYGSSKMKKT